MIATEDLSTESTLQPVQPAASLLVSLASMAPEQLESILSNLVQLAASFPAEGLLIATPDEYASDAYPTLRIISAPATKASWILTAADFVNVYQLAEKNQTRAILMLGPESASLAVAGLHDLADAVLASSV